MQYARTTSLFLSKGYKALSRSTKRILSVGAPSNLQRNSSSTAVDDIRHGAEATSMIDVSNVRGPFGSYKEEYEFSLNQPEKFWARAADKLEWFQKPSTILEYDDQNYPYFARWFSDGIVNMSYNCLDVHVNSGRGKQDALYYDSPVTGVKERFTYDQLLEQVATLAGGLKDLGVESGDRVVIYMPMIPQAIIAMLACCRIGAIHSVVFGGFASKELATRITDCKPKVIVTASAGVEPTRIVPYKPLLDKALELADHDVKHTIIVQRRNVKNAEPATMGPKDLDYDDVMAKSRPVPAIPLPSTHPHHILYTSGTSEFKFLMCLLEDLPV